MRTILSMITFIFMLNKSVLAQMGCDGELLACTNSCAAGGLLGALATRGNAAAVTTTKSCVAGCESRNAACARQAAEATLKQQKIDAKRIMESARQQELDSKVAQMQDQRVEYALQIAEREWNTLETLIFRPPLNNIRPPVEPKPSAILAAAKNLEDTEPLIARNLYLQLAERQDELGKSANAALRRFRQDTSVSEQKIEIIGEPSPILKAIVPQATLQVLSTVRIPSQKIDPNFWVLSYYSEGKDIPNHKNWVTTFGDGFIYNKEISLNGDISQTVSILGDLVPILRYDKNSEIFGKTILVDFSFNGNPFNFIKEGRFSYKSTYLATFRNGNKFFLKKDIYEYDCSISPPTTEIGIFSGKISEIYCGISKNSSSKNEYMIKFFYLHDLKLFSELKNDNFGGYYKNNFDYLKVIKFVALN